MDLLEKERGEGRRGEISDVRKKRSMGDRIKGVNRAHIPIRRVPTVYQRFKG